MGLAAEYENIDGDFVIGTSSFVSNVKITKTGDSSYGSVFCFVLPNYMNYASVKTLRGDKVGCSLLASSTQKQLDNTTSITDQEEACLSGPRNITSGESMLVCSFGNPLKNDSGVYVQIQTLIPQQVTEKSFTVSVIATTLSTEVNSTDNVATMEIDMRHVVTLSLKG